jgi:hypothetical protein
MKCIKAIKRFGGNKVGEIVRVDDESAFQRVSEGNWIYVSKTEWKNIGKTVEEVKEQTTQEVNVDSEVKTKKPKFKKGNKVSKK